MGVAGGVKSRGLYAVLQMTGKHLMLLRHAKSDWSAGGGDFERPLNARGRRDAPKLAAFLQAKNLLPEVAVVSPAARARETLELLCAAWANPPKIVHARELYGGGVDEIRACAARELAGCARLLMVAHNPGMEEAVRAYCPRDVPAGGNLMPTCALARIEIAQADSARGELLELLRPADLK